MSLLSIIIVNFKSSADILECIASAQLHLKGNYEWIIADNSSDEKGKELLLKVYPFIRWIDMKYNAGFARANNAAIRQSSSDIVLLLNPDTIITNNSIDVCLQRFISTPDVACAVQLLNVDGTPQITANHFIKGSLNNFLPLPYLGQMMRRVAFKINTKKTNTLQASAHQNADWINGAFLMVKKTAIERAGLMDEDFFLYAEETEWCYRLGKYGSLCVYGDLNIIHKQGEIITKESGTVEKGYSDIYSKKGGQLLLSNILQVRKHYGGVWFLIHLFVYTVEIPILMVGNILSKIFRHKKYTSYQTKGYITNVITLWKNTFPILFKVKKLYKVM